MYPVQPTTPIARHSRATDADRTHPVTPESPTLRIRSNPRGLRREPAVIFSRSILQYSRLTNSLRPWYWPLNESGKPVKPTDLLEYRISHDFQTPSCLCASLSERNAETAHTEASIFVSSGEYVAACASGGCRYWVNIERMFYDGGLLVKRFPRRFPLSEVPALPALPATPNSESNGGFGCAKMQELEVHLGENLHFIVRSPGSHDPPYQFTVESSLASAPSSPIHAADTQPNGEDVDTSLVPTTKPSHVSEFSLILQLDSFTKPGISEAEFRELFVKCLGCGLYMTRRTQNFHDCESFDDQAESPVTDG